MICVDFLSLCKDIASLTLAFLFVCFLAHSISSQNLVERFDMWEEELIR